MLLDYVGVRTLFIIAHLYKLNLVIIDMNGLSTVQLCQVGIGSNISHQHSLIYDLGNHIWSLLDPINMQIWPIMKLVKVEVHYTL